MVLELLQAGPFRYRQQSRSIPSSLHLCALVRSWRVSKRLGEAIFVAESDSVGAKALNIGEKPQTYSCLVLRNEGG